MLPKCETVATYIVGHISDILDFLLCFGYVPVETVKFQNEVQCFGYFFNKKDFLALAQSEFVSIEVRLLSLSQTFRPNLS